jgi:hydrogenase small subunit
VLSMEYHESLMALAGEDVERARLRTMEAYPDGYFLVVEGAVPSDGHYCLVGGRPISEVIREVSAGAIATIAAGSCATDGGAPGAGGGPTGAGGIRALVDGSKLVALPGCPLNPANLMGTIVHYLTANELPPTDMMGRPYFAYGTLLHNKCERRPHYEYGEFVQTWGDEAALKGWCLYKVGCKGPETFANCPTVRYGDGIGWNIRAGAVCIGCTMPNSWDQMGPAFRRLPSPVPFFPNVEPDRVGSALLAGVGGLAAVHGAAMFVRNRRGGIDHGGHPGPAVVPDDAGAAHDVSEGEVLEREGSGDRADPAIEPITGDRPGAEES